MPVSHGSLDDRPLVSSDRDGRKGECCLHEAAAKKAGFANANAIGPYLRSLIALHHDTLATVVK